MELRLGAPRPLNIRHGSEKIPGGKTKFEPLVIREPWLWLLSAKKVNEKMQKKFIGEIVSRH